MTTLHFNKLNKIKDQDWKTWTYLYACNREEMVINSNSSFTFLENKMCDALSDFVPFVQVKKREKHPWRSYTFRNVASWSATPPWVFFMFFKLYKWYQIAQSITIKKIWKGIKYNFSIQHSVACRKHFHEYHNKIFWIIDERI